MADAHVLEKIFRRRERRGCRLLPLHLQLPRGADRVFFALAHDRDVVTLAHHLDEAGNALHRRLVDADERGAGKRRAHVTRVDHAWHFHVHRPLQRSVHLRWNVVAPRRLADVLHPLHRLQLRDAGGGVGVLAGQGDIEFLAANQLAVGDGAFGGITVSGTDDAVTDGERRRRHAEMLRRHLEQHTARFRRDAAHRVAVGLQCVRSARAALIDGDVGAAHHAGGVLERDVELVAHDLAERRAGALAEIGLADEEGRGVVGADHDPGIELAEIGIRIGPGALERERVERHRARRRNEEAGGLEEFAACS